MARKTKTVTITAEGRDQGKQFLVTEWPPRVGEKWATAVLLAVSRSGGDAGEAQNYAALGMAGLAAAGLQSLTRMAFADAEPLLDRMWECVAFIPDPSKIDQSTLLPYVRPLRDEDIEEVATLLTLRSEVIEVHTGFSPAGFLSTLGKAAKANLSPSPMPTSRKRSGQSSVRD